jgi:hypothetical protein
LATTPLKDNVASALLLLPGDVILSLNGQPLAGHSTQEAFDLFRSCADVEPDGYIHCRMQVARRRPVQETKRVGPLTSEEMRGLVSTMKKLIFDSTRVLGTIPSDDVLQKMLAEDPLLSQRELLPLKAEWSSRCNRLDYRISGAAKAHWQSNIIKRPDSDGTGKLPWPGLTDTKRASLRAAHRPLRGCKCGMKDHEFVNDVDCPLYADLRAKHTDFDHSLNHNPNIYRRKLVAKLPDNFNPVEKATSERLVRQLVEKESREKESRFVDLMEELQMKTFGQAVFSPSLTVMILSAVAELRHRFSDTDSRSPPNKPAPTKGQTESNDDSDDEDVPLTMLVSTMAPAQPPSKIRSEFLYELLLWISRRWGHVFREPSHADYSW